MFCEIPHYADAPFEKTKGKADAHYCFGQNASKGANAK